MQSLIFESPVWIGVIGLAIGFLAAVFWTQTASKIALYSAIGAMVVTALLVMLSIQVKTDREEIESTLHSVARSLKVNDHEAVFRAIHPNAEQTVQQAKRELPKYKFSEARVTRIKTIDVAADTTPPTAMAEFNVVVDVGIEGFGGQRVPRFVRVYFMQRDDRWLVRDYEHFDATAGFRDIPTGGGL